MRQKLATVADSLFFCNSDMHRLPFPEIHKNVLSAVPWWKIWTPIVCFQIDQLYFISIDLLSCTHELLHSFNRNNRKWRHYKPTVNWDFYTAPSLQVSMFAIIPQLLCRAWTLNIFVVQSPVLTIMHASKWKEINKEIF